MESPEWTGGRSMKDPANDPCRFCSTAGPHQEVIEAGGVHYGKWLCVKCGRNLGWIPKPDSDPTKYKRPKSHTDLVSAYSRGFCELCLRKKEDLAKGQTLEAQHVIEYQDGGTSDRSNIWIVCTACHKLIHWQRTYHGENNVQHISTVLTKQEF